MRSVACHKVSVLVEPEIRLVRVTVGPDSSGRDYSRAYNEALTVDPTIAGYDSIWDLTMFNGDATNQDLERMRDVYTPFARPEGPLKYSCLVTSDPCMTLWAAAMDHYFPDRRHVVMRSMGQTEDWLNQIRRRSRFGPRSTGGQLRA